MENPTIWFHLPPLKVICFLWRASIDRIPSTSALALRGVNVANSSCHLCSIGSDDCGHFFVVCSFASEVLRWIFNWCNISCPNFNSVSDLIAFAAKWGRCPKEKKIFLSIIYGYLWCIWKATNRKAFNDIWAVVTNVEGDIMSFVFCWLKFRGKFANCNWAVWESI